MSGRFLSGATIQNITTFLRQAGLDGKVFHRTQSKAKVAILLIMVLSPVGNWAVMPAKAGTLVPALDAIVLRMAQAIEENRAALRSYTVTRNYTLFDNDGETVKSQVVADVKFTPPSSKQFAIRQTQGGLGEKIARGMLEAEVELEQSGKADISADNYNFTFLGEADFSGRHCYVLGLKPRRPEKILISGIAWIDSQTYLPQRLEGEPAKKPSWWVRDLHVDVSFGKAGGMWLDKSLEFTAGIRLVGESKMVVRNLKYDIR